MDHLASEAETRALSMVGVPVPQKLMSNFSESSKTVEINETCEPNNGCKTTEAKCSFVQW